MLVVNTTCVDGSIVFIDPISYSILKKIQLRYTDYELPYKVRRSIKELKAFDAKLKAQKKEKSLTSVISSVIDPNSGDIRIPKLANAILELDRSLIREDIMIMLNALDDDGSGTISIDEFMAYFSEETGDDDDYHKA